MKFHIKFYFIILIKRVFLCFDRNLVIEKSPVLHESNGCKMYCKRKHPDWRENISYINIWLVWFIANHLLTICVKIADEWISRMFLINIYGFFHRCWRVHPKCLPLEHIQKLYQHMWVLSLCLHEWMDWESVLGRLTANMHTFF